MWKKWMNASKWISIRMLCSYLAIIAAPLAAISIFYAQTNRAMLNVQYERSYQLLTEATASFDGQISEMHNVSLYLLKSPELVRFVKGYKERLDEFWEKYYFVKKQPEYGLTNQMIEHVYIMERNARYIVRIPSVVPASSLGYCSVNEFSISSYEELMEHLCAERTYGNILLLENKNGKAQMAMVHSMTGGSREIPGVIMITCKQNMTENILDGAKPCEEALLGIVNQEKKPIYQLPGKKCGIALETLLEHLTPDAKTLYTESVIDNKRYLICMKKAESQPWYYVTATPVSALTRQIHSIRIWMIVLAMLAFCISILICLYHWSKRKDVLRQYTNLREDIELTELDKRSSFWGGLLEVLEYIKHLQATLSLQDGLIKESILRKLLYGEYAEEDRLLADIKYAEMEFPGKECFVVVWSFDGVQRSGKFRDMVEFRGFIREFAKKNLECFHYLYEINYHTLAILISDPAITELLSVRNVFMRCNSRLKEEAFIDGYLGMSGPQRQLRLLSPFFVEAKEACEYARYYHLAAPITKDELPKEPFKLLLPSDKEQEFAHILKNGSMEQTQDFLNWLYRQIETERPGLELANHYRNYVKSSAIRVYSEYCINQTILVKVGQISEADTWNDLFRLILETKQMLQRMVQREVAAQKEKNIEPVCKKILEHMEAHYGETEYCLLTLADSFGVSESKMYKDVRLYFGKSFAEMLEGIRMEHACEQMKQGASIKEVSASCGYHSDVTFRRAFKRVFGMTPTEYGQNL